MANSNAHPVRAECAFRVTGKRPEFWYADTGNIVHPAERIEKEGHTTLNVELAPSGSVFVVFKPTTEQADPIVRTSFGHNQITSTAQLSVQENGALLLASEKSGSYQVTTRSGKVLNGQIPSIPEPLQISGPWDLDFPPNLGAPAHVQLPQLLSWSLHENPGVKYFSGTATYRRTVTVPPEYLAENSSLFLDLGNVQVIAEVEWNGQNLGTLWKPPFSVDITRAAKSGENSLIVKVVNLWPNRLIGDQRLPEDCLWGPPEGPNGSPLAEWPAWFLEGKPSPSGRIAFTTWKAWEKDSPLLESGLLGPVVLRGQKKTILK